MRMVPFVAALSSAVLSFAATVHAAPPEVKTVKPVCQRQDAELAGAIYRGDPTAQPKLLGELPPANETLAVLNMVGGCAKPTTVRYGIGGNTGRR